MYHGNDGFTAVFGTSQVFQVSKSSLVAPLRFSLCISQHLCLLFEDHRLLDAMSRPGSPASAALVTSAKGDTQSCKQRPGWHPWAINKR